MGHGMVGCHFAAVLVVYLKCVIQIQIFGKAYGCNDGPWQNLSIILWDFVGGITVKFVKSTQLCLCSQPGNLTKDLVTYLQGDRHRPHMQDISSKDLAVSSNHAIRNCMEAVKRVGHAGWYDQILIQII